MALNLAPFGRWTLHRQAGSGRLATLGIHLARVTDLHSLYDFIGYVVLCAPNRFPQREYLRPEEQMNLERAFTELRNAIQFVPVGGSIKIDRETLSSVLDESLALYSRGNEVAAAHRLQDFQDIIFQGQAGHA